MGALDEETEALTPLGAALAALPTDPAAGRALLAGAALGVGEAVAVARRPLAADTIEASSSEDDDDARARSQPTALDAREIDVVELMARGVQPRR